MSNRAVKPKYMWAYVGFSIVSGLLSGLVISPVIDLLALLVGLTVPASVHALRLSIEIIVGYFVFRFMAAYFIARPLAAGGTEAKAEFTEHAGLGDGSL